jgi:hypothetical protein
MNLITETKTQYKPLSNVASEIQKSSTEFNTYISRLKDLIGEKSNGLYALDGVKTFANLIAIPKEGNNKVGVEKVLIIDKKGVELFEKLNQLSSDQLQLIGNLWQNQGISKTIFADDYRKDDQLKKLSDQLLFITSNNAISPEKWVEDNLKDKTIEEVFITLTNLQNQVNVSTNALMSSLSEQIGRLEMFYDRFNISAQSDQPSVILGDAYEAEIVLETYSTQARISFSVNGEKIDMKHGKGQYKVKTTSLGEQSYNAAISINNPLTGEMETFSKTFMYKVVAPK